MTPTLPAGPTSGQVADPGEVESAEASACSPGSGFTPDEDLAPAGHKGPWQPETIRDVEWCLERLGDSEAERAEIDAQAKAAIEAIEKRRDAITNRLERRAEWFDHLLEEWARSHRDEIVKVKRKSRELLGGTIGFRSKAEKVVILDEAAVIAWAEQHHLEFLDMRPKLDKRALSAFVLSTGEVPPGCDVEVANEAVHITPNPLPTVTTPKAPKEIE